MKFPTEGDDLEDIDALEEEDHTAELIRCAHLVERAFSDLEAAITEATQARDMVLRMDLIDARSQLEDVIDYLTVEV